MCAVGRGRGGITGAEGAEGTKGRWQRRGRSLERRWRGGQSPEERLRRGWSLKERLHRGRSPNERLHRGRSPDGWWRGAEGMKWAALLQWLRAHHNACGGQNERHSFGKKTMARGKLGRKLWLA
ncbi:hypothetical protein GUJ93_ZPchr0011g28193 [Zizania palustris]|uniref:Uncharacterized protein n=1 Tax=Zizania palustris TaxID=103762 RepID=A0A8J5WHL3_ZIZPA|nr:hypothetical protein GUJ93_ZPchr0011g28193 [Zizania palustris]